MDDTDNVAQNNNLLPQNSTCSVDSNEQNKCDNLPSYQQICFVGNSARDLELKNIAKKFSLPLVDSETGAEYTQNDKPDTIFVLETFSGKAFMELCRSKQPILGSPALRQIASGDGVLPHAKTRPLYNLSMSGSVVCFTGFRNKDELITLVPLIHHMGGSIRKEISGRVTHLIANSCGGPKYQYAAIFKVPVLGKSWVMAAWEKREELSFKATSDSFMIEHKLKPFHGARIRFVGFPEEEEQHMREVLELNGGTVCEEGDPSCTHVVVDESTLGDRPDTNSRAFIVKAEWFWMSVQKEITQAEQDYLYDTYFDQLATPISRRDSRPVSSSSASRRKRKRIHEQIQSLVHQQSPTLHKRRSSVSDAGLLSVSGSFLDCTPSPGKDSSEVVDTPRKGLSQRNQVFACPSVTKTNRRAGSILPPPKIFQSRVSPPLEKDLHRNGCRPG